MPSHSPSTAPVSLRRQPALWLTVAAIVLVIAGGLWWRFHATQAPEPGADSTQPVHINAGGMHRSEARKNPSQHHHGR